MMRYSSVLLTILIACTEYSPYSIALQLSYPESTRLKYTIRDNITITCVGKPEAEEEVMWKVTASPKGIYSIREETPHRNVLEIRHATMDNLGIYYCCSKKNESEYKKMSLFPDDFSWTIAKYSPYNQQIYLDLRKKGLL